MYFAINDFLIAMRKVLKLCCTVINIDISIALIFSGNLKDYGNNFDSCLSCVEQLLIIKKK